MSELLALSTSHPARLTFSLHTLASRGGLTGRAHDGWGVAFYQGQDVALFREPPAAQGIALVSHLETQGPNTSLAVSHIRHATPRKVRCSYQHAAVYSRTWWPYPCIRPQRRPAKYRRQ